MKKLLLILALIFSVNSCDDNMSYKSEMTDSQLIEAIYNDSNRFEIEENEIPQSSQNLIDSEYYDYILITAEISPEFGYLVSMGDMAIDAGDYTEVFFAKDGRKLGNKNGMDRKRHNKRCFKYIFPLSFTLGDQEAIYTVNDYRELIDRLKTNYQETGVKMKPDFTYPIQIQYKGEEAVTINSNQELKAAFQSCRGEQNDKKCFTFGFPVSFTMPDGSILNAEDEEDLEEKMKTFYESYEGDKKRPRVIFPVDLMFEDGSSITVNSVQEMKQAWRDNCRKRENDNDGEAEGTRG